MEKEVEVAHINGKYLIIVAIVGLTGTIVTALKECKPTNKDSEPNLHQQNIDSISNSTRTAPKSRRFQEHSAVPKPSLSKEAVDPNQPIEKIILPKHPTLKAPPKEILPEKVSQ